MTGTVVVGDTHDVVVVVAKARSALVVVPEVSVVGGAVELVEVDEEVEDELDEVVVVVEVDEEVDVEVDVDVVGLVDSSMVEVVPLEHGRVLDGLVPWAPSGPARAGDP